MLNSQHCVMHSKDKMATTKDIVNFQAPAESVATSEGSNVETSSPSWRIPSQSPQFHARHVERTDSDEIFLDLYDSQLPPSSKPLSLQSTPRQRGITSKCQGIQVERYSASSSISSKTSSLASISEEEMLILMESMGEKELISCLPPCNCDECLLREPDIIQHSTRLKRVSLQFAFSASSILIGHRSSSNSLQAFLSVSKTCNSSHTFPI